MNTSFKKPIGIIVDEAADLPQEIIKRNQIGVVPLNMHWPEIEKVPGENLFQRIRELEKRGDNSFGKTSQPSPGAFLDVFKKQLEIFEKVICLTVTSKHSGTYNGACQSKRFLGEEGERVFVVDSLNVTGGAGLIALRTLDLIKKGNSVEQILEQLEDFLPQVKLIVLLEDPKRLEASGRISSTVASWIRRMQKIGVRPLIGVRKGTVSTIGIKAGAKDMPTALFKEMESKTKDLRSKNKRVRVAITHGDNLDRAQALKSMIEKNLKNTEVAFVNLADNVLAVLLGPDALALAWAPIE